MVLKYCGTYIYKNSKIIIYKVLPFKVKYHVTNFNFQSQKKKKCYSSKIPSITGKARRKCFVNFEMGKNIMLSFFIACGNALQLINNF